MFDYQADWVTAIQPQGAGLSALWAAFAWYSALRELGQDVDIIPPTADLSGYALVVLPCLPIVSSALARRLASFAGQVVIGPRSGSRTDEFAIPVGLPPGPLRALFPSVVTRVESLPPGLSHQGQGWHAARWLEELEGDAIPELTTADGKVACWRHGAVRYLAAWPEPDLALTVLHRALSDAGLAVQQLPPGLRLRRAGNRTFVFNYSTETCLLPPTLTGDLVLGTRELPPAGVAVLAPAPPAG